MSALSTFDYAALAVEAVNRCNLCGGESFTPIAHQDRAGFPARTVLCNACGLTFITPRMSAESYAEFYRSGMYRRIVTKLHNRTDEETHDLLIASQQVYAESLHSLLDKHLGQHKGGTLLDVGGSTGIVAESLCQRYGLKGTVLDPAASETDEARQRGLTSIEGTVESWDSPELFDVIGIFQSIDHFLDIAGALKKVRRWLKPGGTFVVDIVEIRTLLAYCPEIAFKVDHPHGLTDWTMRAYLARAGFKLKRWGVSGEKRKCFYVCGLGEPVDVLPEPEAVEEMRTLCGVAG